MSGRQEGKLRGLPFRELAGHAKGSSRNFRHKQPVGHALLEVSDYRCLSPGDRGRECLARSRSELDDVRAVSLRAVDHDMVLAAYRRFFLLHSSSSSRFTAGAAAFFILSQSGERPER